MYSRGVNKGAIFHSASDYFYFTECTMLYLIPRGDLMNYLLSISYSKKRIYSLISKAESLKNYAEDISLYAYCLMPNHFHFLLQQNTDNAMPKFIKSLLTRYSMYYSMKYQYVGHLFQGRYKAIGVKSDAYFQIVREYIHNNPNNIQKYRNKPYEYPWSSAYDYINPYSTRPWIKTARS